MNSLNSFSVDVGMGTVINRVKKEGKIRTGAFKVDRLSASTSKVGVAI